MLASFGHLASATELWRGIVDEKFGDDGQKRRRLPSPHTDEAVKDPIQKSGIAPVGVQRYQRFGLRHMDRHARHTEQAEWMPTRHIASLSVVSAERSPVRLFTRRSSHRTCLTLRARRLLPISRTLLTGSDIAAC